MKSTKIDLWVATIVSDYRFAHNLTPADFSLLDKTYSVVKHLYANYDYYHIESNETCIAELDELIRKKGEEKVDSSGA